MTRERLPDRRRSWTQKVRIEGQTFYLSVGEYPDGRPGEVFVEASKEGTFLRGIMTAFARTASVSLQCRTPVREVVKSLRELDFPPKGVVTGSPSVTKATSVADWVAQELAAHYLTDRSEPEPMLPAGGDGETSTTNTVRISLPPETRP